MKIYKDGQNLFFINHSEILYKLNPVNHTVKYDKKAGYYLSLMDEFAYPSKIYGDYSETIQRYKTAYDNLDGNIGILLNGEKGSGKTLLSRLLCREMNLPVLIVQEPIRTEFIDFITGINQDLIIFIDEFDKIYSKNFYDDDDNEVKVDQKDLLKIMDGGFKTKIMFILTSNENSISEYMVNRPSRIRYIKEFNGVDEKTLNEVCQDKLINKNHLNDILLINEKYQGFNLDLLLCLIEETNLFDKSPMDLIGDMNISMKQQKYNMDLIYKDQAHKSYHTINNPLVKGSFIGSSINFIDREVGNLFDYNIDNYTISVNGDTIEMKHKTKDFTLLLTKAKQYIYSI